MRMAGKKGSLIAFSFFRRNDPEGVNKKLTDLIRAFRRSICFSRSYRASETGDSSSVIEYVLVYLLKMYFEFVFSSY